MSSNTRLFNLVYSQICEFYEYMSTQDSILTTAYCALLRVGLEEFERTYKSMSQTSPRSSILNSIFILKSKVSGIVVTPQEMALSQARFLWMQRFNNLISLEHLPGDEVNLIYFTQEHRTYNGNIGGVPSYSLLLQKHTSWRIQDKQHQKEEGRTDRVRMRETVTARCNNTPKRDTTQVFQIGRPYPDIEECDIFCASCAYVFRHAPISKCNPSCHEICPGWSIGWYPHCELGVWQRVHCGDGNIPAPAFHRSPTLSLHLFAIPQLLTVCQEILDVQKFLEELLLKGRADAALVKFQARDPTTTRPLYYKYSGNDIVRNSHKSGFSRKFFEIGFGLDPG